jgi:membrane-associated phospholipid phosphatase
MRSRIMFMSFVAFLISSSGLLAQNSAPSSPAQIAPNSEAPPTPEHTGWATLVKDTAHDFVAFPQRKSTWTLLGVGAAAALATHPADDYVERHIVGNKTAENVFKLGKWVGSAEVEVGTAVGLWAIGRYVLAPAKDEPRANTVSHLGLDLIRAQILSQALVQGIKYSVRRDRPTGECCAFPSGHAATAFALASVLERHLGYRASWPALAGATYVATSRLVDNRHFLSDVMFGAAVGMASGWTVVGRHGRESYALQPVPIRGGAMISFVRLDHERTRPSGD